MIVAPIAIIAITTTISIGRAKPIGGVTIEKVPVNPSTSTLTISTTLTTPAGTYTITITGAGGGKTHSSTYTLTVTTAPPENTTPTQIDIKVENAAENVKIIVQEVPEDSVGTVSEAPGLTYKYLRIAAENTTDAQIKNVTIRFAVEKSWIAKNRIDTRTITLNHYNSTTDNWKPLPTNFLYGDNTYSYFSAVSPSLSVFGISGQQLQTDSTLSVSPTLRVLVVGIAVVILIVSAMIAVIFFYRRNPESETEGFVQAQ
jgi:PGF-pre-PGF domain-containing protein